MPETLEISFDAYGTMFNLGYHVGFNALPDPNPADPDTLEHEAWADGHADGTDERAVRSGRAER
jgi:hypothetical protein